MANNTNSSNVIHFIVRNQQTGVIDAKATVNNFHTQLDDYMSTHRAAIKQIAEAVNAVFDQNPGKALPMDAIKGYALNNLEHTPDQYSELSELVGEYVSNDPNFEVRRGRGGGVRRKSDVQASQVETADIEEEEEAPPAPVVRKSQPAPRASTVPPAKASQRPSARAAAR